VSKLLVSKLFYDRGLGTGWSRSEAISGFGIRQNIHRAYQFLLDNFHAGDQIFMLGFSRGATTVRTLSSFIALFGILPQCDLSYLIKRGAFTASVI
jgi:uncharacterized protein (DUF2235 family)